MRSAIIGFVVGVGLLQCQATLPSFFTISLLVLAAASLLLRLYLARLHLARQYVSKTGLLLVSGAVLGFAWAALLAHIYLAQTLPLQMEGQDITVIGTVDSLPELSARGVRFNFSVEQTLPPAREMQIPSRIALSWYDRPDANGAQQRRPSVHAGERWRLTVRLHRPHGNANPYGFDYEAWLLEQGIRATGYVRDSAMDVGDAQAGNQRLLDFVPGFDGVVGRSREWLRERIQRNLQGKPYAGVIVALVVGDQRAIGEQDWTVFKRTGISHLMSISGLHITMIAAMFAWLTMNLWRRSFFTGAQLPLLLPAQKAAALAGVLAALIYVLLAGAGIPAQRTLCMLTVVAIALWCGRLTQVSHVLCMALGAVLLFDPWAVLMPGFWLSFAAVAAILYVSVEHVPLTADASTPLHRWRGNVATALRTQYAITLGLVPLTILLFAQTSLVSPLANAVAIPLVSFLVTPAALLGSVLPAPLSGWILNAAHFLVASLMQFLQYLSGLPMAVWLAPVPAWWMFALAAIGTVWMLAPRGWPARYLGAFLWLPLVLNAPSHPAAGEMWITAFDVGQGMAVLVETAEHRLLYDTGPGYSAEADAGNRIILPYLRARGIATLDTMMISHGDSDHSGGALSILQQMEVGQLVSSLPTDSPIVAVAPRHVRCVAGRHWRWDGVDFDILYPAAHSPAYTDDSAKSNARSCVLKITQGRHAALLPGDIEAAQEAELLAAGAGRLRADVLLAPHHGSGTSSTPPFLQAVAPQLAVFQVGYRNRYHHPKPQVFERYAALGIRRLRSDADGAVTLGFASGISVQTYRSEHARYWYGQ